MQYFILAALAALVIGFMDIRPASAAWQCMGPAYACSEPTAAPKKVWKKGRADVLKSTRMGKASALKARKYASKKSHRASARLADGHKAARRSRSVVSSGSYGGGYGGGSVGIASYYFQGTRTASGARFNPSGMTAAHRSLPFGTRVLVTHLASGRSVTVTINDRGPFVKGRIIDLSRGAATALGITGSGLAKVSVAVMGRG